MVVNVREAEMQEQEAFQREEKKAFVRMPMEAME